jgi:hypothetical protein
MISRLVTVDLLLTFSQRLHQLPEYRNLDVKELYDISTLILNAWAQRIESEGLSVSLRAIVENVFLVFQADASIDSLLDLANQLIDCAGRIESLLSGERLVQPAQTQSLQELENAVGDKASIEWFAGAKQIIGIANSTDAANTLKEALTWLLNDRDPPANSLLRQFLTKAINGAQPDIPRAFASLFKDRYLLVFKSHRQIEQYRRRQKRTKNRNPAESS